MDIQGMVKYAPLSLSAHEREQVVEFARNLDKAAHKVDAAKNVASNARASVAFDLTICPAVAMALRAGVRALDEGLIALEDGLHDGE